MRQLLLLRHAKSSWDDAAQSDHGRALDASGLEAAVAIGGALRALGLAPDLILVSSARRTLQTLEALETPEPWDEAPLVEPMDALYLATAPQLLAVLNKVPETVRSVLVIGHNPGLHDLALTLAGAHALSAKTPLGPRLAAGFPTASLAEFTVAPRWADLGEGGGRLVRFLTPKDLPERAQ
jgi:phosphohistidine phosphatase